MKTFKLCFVLSLFFLVAPLEGQKVVVYDEHRLIKAIQEAVLDSIINQDSILLHRTGEQRVKNLNQEAIVFLGGCHSIKSQEKAMKKLA